MIIVRPVASGKLIKNAVGLQRAIFAVVQLVMLCAGLCTAFVVCGGQGHNNCAVQNGFVIYCALRLRAGSVSLDTSAVC